jgi:porphobilinogen synthase
MTFPKTRLRRLRRSASLRRMVRETRLSRDDLVLPLFVVEGRGVREPVASMPGVLRFSADTIVTEAKTVRDAGIPAVLLFGIPDQKDARGSGADAANGVVQRAVDAIKSAEPDLCVITDVCLCEYTDHGHCGIVENGDVANDPTLERLAAAALSHARAGADVVAPSDMMDGRVAAIRDALDAHGFDGVAISPTPRNSRAPLRALPEARRAPRASATAAPTNWTRRTDARRCARCAPTSRRAPTC